MTARHLTPPPGRPVFGDPAWIEHRDALAARAATEEAELDFSYALSNDPDPDAYAQDLFIDGGVADTWLPGYADTADSPAGREALAHAGLRLVDMAEDPDALPDHATAILEAMSEAGTLADWLADPGTVALLADTDEPFDL